MAPGDLGSRERADLDRSIRAAEQHRDHRLGGAGRGGIDVARRGVDVLRDGRCIDHHDTVDFVAGERCTDGSRIVGGGGAPVERDGAIDRDEASRLECCPCKNSRAARVGDHGDVWSLEGRLGRHHPDGLEQRRHRGNLDESGLLVERAAHLAGCGRSGSDCDDGLGPRHPTGDAGELAGVTERFGVHRDDGRVVVLLPELQQVVGRDVALVAERHEPRHPQADIARLAQERSAERPRLHRDRQATRWQRDIDQGGLEAGLGER